MATNKETKLSLKEKLYQETLDEFAIKQWNPESLKNDFKNWKEMTKVYPKKDRGWLIYQADIEKAVMLAIEKTYSALQSGGLTEAGQSLYDRRKDIEAHTAKQILDDAKRFVFKITYDDDISEEEQMQINFYMTKVVEQYSAFLKKLQKKYGVLK